MTDHDQRHDCATELMTVSELLDNEGLPETAAGARDAALAVMVGDITIRKGWNLLGRFENLLGGN